MCHSVTGRERLSLCAILSLGEREREAEYVTFCHWERRAESLYHFVTGRERERERLSLCHFVTGRERERG